MSLERALLWELAAAAEQALHVDFSVLRARRGGGGIGLGAPPRTVYREFVAGLRAARLEPLAARYPVLARLLAVRVGLWVSSSAELVARAAADAGELGSLFGGGEPGRIVELHTGRGDTHCGGRAVATVRFASGLEVMYKPRSMQLDLAFCGLLEVAARATPARRHRGALSAAWGGYDRGPPFPRAFQARIRERSRGRGADAQGARAWSRGAAAGRRAQKAEPRRAGISGAARADGSDRAGRLSARGPAPRAGARRPVAARAGGPARHATRPGGRGWRAPRRTRRPPRPARARPRRRSHRGRPRAVARSL